MSMTSGAPLTVLVLIKYTPDTQFPRSLGTAVDSYRLDRSESVLSELDEYAVETALRIRESRGAETRVTALSMGPESASAALKKALQMGADDAVLISDPALAGSDALATSRVLAAAVDRVAPGLVITGMTSTDAETGVLPSMLAARLGWAQLTLADHVELTEALQLRATRTADGDRAELTAELPAVLSVTDQTPSPRYPNFKAILSARKKPLATWGLSELGLDGHGVGEAGSATVVVEAGAVAGRQGGRVITDDGGAGVTLVDFLDEHGLIGLSEDTGPVGAPGRKG